MIKASAMEFAAKLDEADLNDVRRLARPKNYWLKFVLANWYATALVLLVAYATIVAIIGQTRPNWNALGLVWLVLGGLIWWSSLRVKRKRTRHLKQLNASLPDQISLTKDGVNLSGPNGATGFFPWSNFKGWREGQRVILLDHAQGSQAVILPVAGMSENERQSVRDLMRSHVPVRGG